MYAKIILFENQDKIHYLKECYLKEIGILCSFTIEKSVKIDKIEKIVY